MLEESKRYASIAILTKTNKQAKNLYALLKGNVEGISLISNNQDVLRSRVSIMSAYNSKGLEFDYVIVYDASPENYNSIYDNNLLFICASRAMHKLDLLTKSDFCDILKEYKKKNNKGETND